MKAILLPVRVHIMILGGTGWKPDRPLALRGHVTNASFKQ